MDGGEGNSASLHSRSLGSKLSFVRLVSLIERTITLPMNLRVSGRCIVRCVVGCVVRRIVGCLVGAVVLCLVLYYTVSMTD